MPADALTSAKTPFPYAVGHNMWMTNSEGEKLPVAITALFPLTVWPVMEVQIRTKKGFQKAILKLYDRRFGYMRDKHTLRKNEPNVHSQWVEECWHRYLRQGSAKALAARLHRMDEEWSSSYRTDSDDDEDLPQWEETAKTEGVIHHVAQTQYKTETQAYEQLRDLQGRAVTRLISTATLDLSSTQSHCPADLSPIYFQIRGILLQRINGFNLDDMLLHVPGLPAVQEQIIQSAIDAAIEVNQAGVLHFDMAPRNVMASRLDDHTFQAFIIDFAECGFKSDYEDTDDEDGDGEDGVHEYEYDPLNLETWSRILHACDNPGAIGCVMTMRLRRLTGFDPKLKIGDQELKCIGGSLKSGDV
ncbi:hypothetical protein F4778DRAFT_749075 [Xylariomycetidae sp. FL2044]|nr:hypothetical protein F4778DRAFT_749075 [Xylariomycetidae sp. FL2044]